MNLFTDIFTGLERRVLRVCFGSFADVTDPLANVRFVPEADIKPAI